MPVLLVAVKKDRIADYTSVIVQAGREPVLVDVDVFALQNAFEVNYGLGDETAALVNVGASVMNINVLHRGTSIFWRDVAFGGNQYTEAIQRELNLPREEAERLKLGERVGAWIRLVEGEEADAEELREYARGRVAHYKVPEQIWLVNEFPMTVTGKIQKFRIREIVAEGRAGADADSDADALRSALGPV